MISFNVICGLHIHQQTCWYGLNKILFLFFDPLQYNNKNTTFLLNKQTFIYMFYIYMLQIHTVYVFTQNHSWAKRLAVSIICIYYKYFYRCISNALNEYSSNINNWYFIHYFNSIIMYFHVQFETLCYPYPAEFLKWTCLPYTFRNIHYQF